MIDVKELKPRNVSYYGKGSINKNGNEVYKLTHGSTYYCSCRTYEQAYYVREELNKCNWDKNELQRILDEYPVYYTDLLEFYRYVTVYNASSMKWCVSIPSNKSDNGVTQQIRCSRIEDALFERDFLVEHDWDYELLVYVINDFDNPYYDVELPPYPQRKIKNISIQKSHREELLLVNKLLLENKEITQSKICEHIGISDMTLRNWLKDYGTTWKEYKKMVFNGMNPLDHLKLKRHIYTPDLSLIKKKNFKSYISYDEKRSKKNPYSVVRNRIRYGQYPTKELAEQVAKDLSDCNWNKKKLKSIWKKNNYVPFRNKNYVYLNNSGTFMVRKKVNGKFITFGNYEDYDCACYVRDVFVKHGWNVDNLVSIRESAELEYMNRNCVEL